MVDRNLGDIHPKFTDPIETYYDVVRQGVRLGKRKWIRQPDWKPPVIKGMEGFQAVLEEHSIPRAWELLRDLWVRFQCGTYFVKNPNWIEPPITATQIDLRTDAGVVLVRNTDVQVVTFTVPDRVVGTLLGFGHNLDVATEWDNVDWSIRINRKPVPAYDTFRQQIGNFVNPTLFPAPIKVKHRDVVEVIADQTGVPAVNAFARLIGFMYPVKKITGDGSYEEYHTL